MTNFKDRKVGEFFPYRQAHITRSPPIWVIGLKVSEQHMIRCIEEGSFTKYTNAAKCCKRLNICA